MLCGINTNGTYIPPKTPQMTFTIVRIPLGDNVLNVKNIENIDIADVINAPIIKATINNTNDKAEVGIINLILLGIKKAQMVNGKHLINVAEIL